MNRRAALQSLFKSPQAPPPLNTATLSLDPYSGEWTSKQAAHLLKRTTFATCRDAINEVTDNGLTFTIDQLLADRPLPDPPINYYEEDDPMVPIGATWIEARTGSGLNQHRVRSLRGWTFNQMINEGIHIREKMVLFWHNHFVTASQNDPRTAYQYINLIRSNAIGDFRQLTKDMTINPAMLRYLTGNENVVGSPNENYARELLELFTIGKGPVAGPGDYTNYTEQDIEAIARALTGWRFRGNGSTTIDIIESYFTSNRHDTDDKQLSHRFGNATISDNGEAEYADVVDIIFEQEEVSKFICRKLYRYFVDYRIDDNVETNIIEPLASTLRENNYDIKSVLQVLLSSQCFFQDELIGTMIKNPIDYVVSVLNKTETTPPNDVAMEYEFGLQWHTRAGRMQMQYFEPPDVAGWRAYYKEPTYYRLWISAVTLPERFDFVDDLVLRNIKRLDYKLSIDPLSYVDALPTDISLDPNLLISELVTVFFCHPIANEQLVGLKEILIPGLPDFEWTDEYQKYLNAAGSDDALTNAVRNKLKGLFRAMLTMPEFFLC